LQTWPVLLAVTLSVFALLLGKDMTRKTMVSLDILLMLLVLVLFTLNKKWEKESITLFLNCISVSLICASIEICFSNIIRTHPVIQLVCVLGFWVPLSIPFFYIGQRSFGLIGGVFVIGALFFIAVRDIVQRKKRLDKQEKENGGTSNGDTKTES
jgi:hypothetical protein